MILLCDPRFIRQYRAELCFTACESYKDNFLSTSRAAEPPLLLQQRSIKYFLQILITNAWWMPRLRHSMRYFIFMDTLKYTWQIKLVLRDSFEKPLLQITDSQTYIVVTSSKVREKERNWWIDSFQKKLSSWEIIERKFFDKMSSFHY